jgi:hypothetical protein
MILESMQVISKGFTLSFGSNIVLDTLAAEILCFDILVVNQSTLTTGIGERKTWRMVHWFGILHLSRIFSATWSMLVGGLRWILSLQNRFLASWMEDPILVNASNLYGTIA